jgi:hypothetical protein
MLHPKALALSMVDPSRNLAPSNHLPSGLRTDPGNVFWIDLNLVQSQDCINHPQIVLKSRDYRLLMLVGLNLLIQKTVELALQTLQFADEMRSLLREP